MPRCETLLDKLIRRFKGNVKFSAPPVKQGSASQKVNERPNANGRSSGNRASKERNSSERRSSTQSVDLIPQSVSKSETPPFFSDTHQPSHSQAPAAKPEQAEWTQDWYNESAFPSVAEIMLPATHTPEAVSSGPTAVTGFAQVSSSSTGANSNQVENERSQSHTVPDLIASPKGSQSEQRVNGDDRQFRAASQQSADWDTWAAHDNANTHTS